MAQRIKVVLDHAAVGEYLRGETVRAALYARAEKIAEAANATTGGRGGYIADSTIGDKRALASVETATYYAMAHEGKHNVLARAAEAGKRV